MDPEDIIRGIQPLVGQVIPIRTVQETQPIEEFADAYVAEVNVKSASKVIKVLDSAFPRDSSQPMNHLRRFAKHSTLPDPLRPILLKDTPLSQTIFVLIPPPLPELDYLWKLLSPFAPLSETISSSSSTTTQHHQDGDVQIPVHTIKVPILPPLNISQAETWSKSLWPVVFNPAAARSTVAPPPQILNRTCESIQPNAGYYFALARKVADEAERSGKGRGVGAVVVDPEITKRIEAMDEDPDSRWADAIVAVAGDRRYSRREAGALSEAEIQLAIGPNPARETYNPDLEGGPELHALMRAVELIAYKRRADDPTAVNDQPSLSQLESYFLSEPDFTSSDPQQDISPVPEKYQKTGKDSNAVSKLPQEDVPAARIRPRAQGGYLCTDLDVYLTHEPCICCSMGLLLSRFRSVIFPRRGRMVTGGMASEPAIIPVVADEPPPSPQPSSTEKQNKEAVENHTQEPKQLDQLDEEGRRLYYGIHWRKELNWRALGFEFVEDGVATEATAENGIGFHA